MCLDASRRLDILRAAVKCRFKACRLQLGPHQIPDGSMTRRRAGFCVTKLRQDAKEFIAGQITAMVLNLVVVDGKRELAACFREA